MTRRFVVVRTDERGDVSTLGIVVYTDRADAEARVAERREMADHYGWPDRYEVAELVPAEPSLPSIHDADAPNAMVNAAGERFFPDGPEDAEHFAEHHGAAFTAAGRTELVPGEAPDERTDP